MKEMKEILFNTNHKLFSAYICDFCVNFLFLRN